jgi:hypothetical protein
VEFIGDFERAFASTIYPNRLLIAIIGSLILVAIVVRARRRRLDLVARRHPGRTLVAVLVATAVIGSLGWYLGSPLFLSTTFDEAPPVAAGDPSPAPASAFPPASPSARSDASTEPSEPTPSATATPIERTGTFAGADEFHFGEGTARLIETSTGTFTVRLEDFAVRNGPDLYVYLSRDADGYADGAIELGRLKADRGNQNYEVPAGTNLSNVESVVIWCKQFSVLFATATLS